MFIMLKSQFFKNFVLGNATPEVRIYFGVVLFFKFNNIFSFNKAVLLDSMVPIVIYHAAVTAHIVTT